MKEELTTKVYPIIIREESDGYLVIVPDFDYETQGTSISDSIVMARDLIGMLAIHYFNNGKELPESGHSKLELEKGDIETLVDIDLKEYFKMYDTKLVKKTLSIPTGLNERAVKENINFSQLLTDSLYSLLLNKKRT